ncbi:MULTISPECIES: FtsX-like permease family protein [Bacillus]|uniref:FtsX-like permease family protein n=1 Tax=Bacillus TaxID=1386 RepID=UPI0001A1986B|nr:ABC transporter permease [Bacillus pseudomycoides]EEM13770.1 ABC transporter, permease protein [Bacillus pseudomycoides DSM 12442]MED1594178.1 ABC transporter permease [Bacillus pseudomycoides]MED4714535.1 ABC transporter permease [Bacillus pseudomycoides]OOR49513.1 ABC transporter permease [Bacillus pseudomycoides]PDY09002.1 ABC transporter permease [Bacillus pseudomycoides]
MLFKLSMSGLTSKLKDYIVLLVGLVMSISIFYMFQTLAQNEAFLKSNSTISQIGFVFHAGTVLLAIITFFYILYANSFLLSLRQKEFGMYMMLGAKKHKVTFLMFIETIVLGAASLVIGIAVGVGLSQGVGQLLMKQLEFTGGGYQAFYVPSITVTCIFFCALFVLAAIMNSIKLSRISVLQLVHADAQTERPVVKGKITGIVAVFAIILLGVGYHSMINISKLQEMGVIIALITITSGTYMLFGSALPFMIKKLKSNKKRSEKGLNAFTFAQLNFRINSLTKVLATIAMLVALGAGAISTGMAFKNNVMRTVDTLAIYDVAIHNPSTEEKKILDGMTFQEKNEYHYKTDDKYVYYIKEELEKNRPLVQDSKNATRLADASKIKRVSEELPVGATLSYIKKISDNVIPEEWRAAFKKIQPHYLYTNQTIKIVDKKMYDGLQGKENIAFLGKTNDFLTYKKELKKIDELQLAKYKIAEVELTSKYSIYTEFYGFTSGTVFMGFFLGIAFLAMMASCLMFKILSGASKDITRYQMLRKIGVRRELLTKSIYKELFLVFLFPAIVGIAHVLVGMNMFGFILHDPYFRIWVPIVMFVVIYAIYYFITVQLYKRIVLPKED